MRSLQFLLMWLLAILNATAATTVFYFPTTNDMISLTIPKINNRVIGVLSGFATTNSGNGGVFLFDTNSTETVDMADVFKPTAGGGRWSRLTLPVPSGAVPTSRLLTAGSGLTGGGDLSADRTFTVGAGIGITVNVDDVGLDTASTRNTDHASVTLTAGGGLTGGGDISANRTFAVGAGTGITVNADDVAIANTAVTPASYGSGTQVGTFTVDQQGRLTAAANTSIAGLAASVITSGTFDIARIPTITLGKGGLNADFSAAADWSLIGKDGAVMSAISPNTAASQKFLAMTGTGAAGAEPTWVTVSTSSGANPSATIGLSTVNGVATTFLRSDGASALSQAIVPTWTGTHTFTNATYSGLFRGGNTGFGAAADAPTAVIHVLGDSGTETAALAGVSAWFQRSASSTANSYVGLISGTLGITGMLFGDTDDQDIGMVYYNHSADSLSLRANNADRVSISSAGVVNIGQLTASKYVKTDGSKNLVSADIVAADVPSLDASKITTGVLTVAAAGVFNIARKVNNYTSSSSDCMVIFSGSTGGNITNTLPVSSVPDGHMFMIIKESGDTVVIQQAGGGPVLDTLTTARPLRAYMWLDTEARYQLLFSQPGT